MQSWYVAPKTGERAVLYGRLLFAALSLLGTIANSPQSLVLQLGASAYVAYGLVLLSSKGLRGSRRERLATHTIDLAYAAAYVALSGGAGPPVLALVVFCILSAAIRLDLRATALTACGVVLLFGLGSFWFSRNDANAFGTIGMRFAQLAVIATLMVAVAAYLARLRGDLGRLASWIPSLALDADDLISDLLQQAAVALGCPRAIMVWSEDQEPWTYVGSWSGGAVRCEKVAPGKFDPPVEGHLASETFFCEDASLRSPSLLYYSGRQNAICETAINDELRQRFDIRSVISFPLEGATFVGRVFCLDRPNAAHDDLRLAIILRRLMTAEMDRYYLTQHLRRAAVVEDRVRLGRDLHDGLLQSLTAATLQLQVARRLIPIDPGRAVQVLAALHDDLIRAFEELGTFIRTLRPGSSEHEPVFRLDARLLDLARAVERQWAVPVTVSLDSIDERAPESSRKAVFQLLREAVINAAKHSGAAKISVSCAVNDGAIEMTVADDGVGFSFAGAYTLSELVTNKRGPRTLKERLIDLEGDLTLTSTERGATLQIRLPLEKEPP